MEDLQWADVASLDLLEVLVTDRENKGLLVVGCYRSNEIADNETHILSKFLRDVKEKSSHQQQGGGAGGFGVTEIHIGNLALDNANQIIMAGFAGVDTNLVNGNLKTAGVGFSGRRGS